jgi:hypothetical protein
MDRMTDAAEPRLGNPNSQCSMSDHSISPCSIHSTNPMEFDSLSEYAHTEGRQPIVYLFSLSFFTSSLGNVKMHSLGALLSSSQTGCDTSS